MDWFKNFWRQLKPARKYLIIGALLASGVGAPIALPVATGIDNGISEIEESFEN